MRDTTARATCPSGRATTGSAAFRIKLYALMVAAALFVPLSPEAHEYKAGTLEIVHPWLRAPVPGAKVAAGYLTLKNSGQQVDRLESVSTDLAGKVEVHEMSVDSAGVMTMRRLAAGVEIPPGATVELKPGSLHIMFINLREQPPQDGKVKATLTFEKAGSVEVEFSVEAPVGGEVHEAH